MRELARQIRTKADALNLGEFTLELHGSAATLWSENPDKVTHHFHKDSDLDIGIYFTEPNALANIEEKYPSHFSDRQFSRWDTQRIFGLEKLLKNWRKPKWLGRAINVNLKKTTLLASGQPLRSYSRTIHFAPRRNHSMWMIQG